MSSKSLASFSTGNRLFDSLRGGGTPPAPPMSGLGLAPIPLRPWSSPLYFSNKSYLVKEVSCLSRWDLFLLRDVSGVVGILGKDLGFPVKLREWVSVLLDWRRWLHFSWFFLLGFSVFLDSKLLTESNLFSLIFYEEGRLFHSRLGDCLFSISILLEETSWLVGCFDSSEWFPERLLFLRDRLTLAKEGLLREVGCSVGGATELRF